MGCQCHRLWLLGLLCHSIGPVQTFQILIQSRLLFCYLCFCCLQEIAEGSLCGFTELRPSRSVGSVWFLQILAGADVEWTVASGRQFVLVRGGELGLAQQPVLALTVLKGKVQAEAAGEVAEALGRPCGRAGPVSLEAQWVP